MKKRTKRIDNCLECTECVEVVDNQFSFVYSEVENRTCMRAHVRCIHIKDAKESFPRIEWLCKKFNKSDRTLSTKESELNE
jgi:hypothetical protein